MPKADRIGLVIVLASLIAIGVIVSMVFRNQHEDQLADIRSKGVGLVRALSAMPYEQLGAGDERHALLQVLRHSSSDADFAYVSIVNEQAETISELAADGVIVPAAELPATPTTWLGETQMLLVPEGRKVIEFHAPLFDEKDLGGFVRLGYHYPTIGLSVSQIPFLATVALPVFLLAPLFYFLLRLEVRPVRAANREISRLIDGDSFRRLEVAATGELGDFMQRFNSFVELAGTRIDSLEQDQQRLITSSKLLTYRKNRVETVLETLPEAVLILDESGAITFVNQKLAAMFDVSQEAILSKPPQSWCDNPDVLQLLARYQTGSNARTFTDTIRFNIDAARDRAIATKTYPLFAPNDPTNAIGTLIIFRDETQESLARQARADFVAHLSHELKSPLNVLGLYSESLMSEQGKDDAFRIEAANVISDEVDRLSALITGLLSMTQIENGSLTPDRTLVRLGDVARAAFDEAKHSAKNKSIKFILDTPKEMSPVNIDKDLMRIAINNLLSNAVKYNSSDGSVSLSIVETEDAVQIRVADTGIGISNEDAAKVFDKFYRAANNDVQSVAGHGLGLSLTKQIVELHRGSLSLNRDRETGVEFIINLWKEATAVKQAI